MIAYTDYSAGTLGALATVAALLARERTGRGQRVDVSLFRTGYVAQAAETADGPVGGRDHRGPAACRRIYACRDGWVCIAARRADEAAALGRLVGADVGLADPAEGPAAAAIAHALADVSRADALERLAAAGVPAAPCRAFQELFTEPSFRERDDMVEQTHPALGALLMPGPFMRFDATLPVLRRSAPMLGADGPDVLAEIGYSAERIGRLLADGVVGRPT
jgi:crotonobetainyl-CoA:carnitine CoA-transferase CaiB-like acyl-CoA transferase